jgi:hypothetical protein
MIELVVIARWDKLKIVVKKYVWFKIELCLIIEISTLE